MTTKHADLGSTSKTRLGKVAVAFWLEYGPGVRVTKLYRDPDKPLVFAGRALESIGSLERFAFAKRDGDGARHIVGEGARLEVMARPFMPSRTSSETEAMDRHFTRLRAIGFRPPVENTDERVYW